MKLADTIERFARGRTQTHVSLLAIAGGYLLYLVYDIIKGMSAGTGSRSALMCLFAGLFTLCGLLLCLGGIYALWKGWYRENSPPAGDADDGGDSREE